MKQILLSVLIFGFIFTIDACKDKDVALKKEDRKEDSTKGKIKIKTVPNTTGMQEFVVFNAASSDIGSTEIVLNFTDGSTGKIGTLSGHNDITRISRPGGPNYKTFTSITIGGSTIVAAPTSGITIGSQTCYVGCKSDVSVGIYRIDITPTTVTGYEFNKLVLINNTTCTTTVNSYYTNSGTVPIFPTKILNQSIDTITIPYTTIVSDINISDCQSPVVARSVWAPKYLKGDGSYDALSGRVLGVEMNNSSNLILEIQ